MPNARAAGQKLINIPIDEKALIELDKMVTAAGYPDRSKFIRDAICEKLERLGYKVPKELFVAPSRIGKGGRPTHRAEQPEHARSGHSINSTVRGSDQVTEARKQIVSRKVRQIRKP